MPTTNPGGSFRSLRCETEGRKAAHCGLVLESPPANHLDARVEELADRGRVDEDQPR